MQTSANRYGRERIDLPLAFASMELPVKVFLLGNALYDLHPKQSKENTWSKLWTMLTELEADICIPRQSSLTVSAMLAETTLRVIAMDDQQLAQAMAGCRHLLHI